MNLTDGRAHTLGRRPWVLPAQGTPGKWAIRSLRRPIGPTVPDGANGLASVGPTARAAKSTPGRCPGLGEWPPLRGNTDRNTSHLLRGRRNDESLCPSRADLRTPAVCLTEEPPPVCAYHLRAGPEHNHPDSRSLRARGRARLQIATPLLVLMMPFSWLAIHMKAQFADSRAHLMPGFRRGHAIVAAAAVLIVVVLLPTLLTWAAVRTPWVLSRSPCSCLAQSFGAAFFARHCGCCSS